MVRVDDRVYLLTGADGSTAVYFARINPDGSLGGWTATASLPQSRQNFAAAAYDLGDGWGYVYVSGGNAGGTRDSVQDAVVLPDGSLGTWRDTTLLPQPMEGHVMVVAGQGLYVLSPTGATCYAPILSGGSLEAWQQTTTLPGPRSAFSAFAAGAISTWPAGTRIRCSGL